MKTFSSIFFAALLLTSLQSCAQKEKKAVEHPSVKELTGLSVATFAAGCFWHEEALFESIKGVKEAVSGYAGGSINSPSYEGIETGETGHAETVNVYYNPAEVSYATLLKVYFEGQNPTQVNGQGPDHGTQYRSIIFYRNDAEKRAAESYKGRLQPKFSEPIAAEIVPFKKFWTAEKYHQDYIEHHPYSGYVQMVSIPEIKKLQKELPELVKPDHVF